MSADQLDQQAAALPVVDARRLGPGSTDNPYWDEVRALPGEDITMRYERRWEPRSFPWPDTVPWRQGKPPDRGPSREDLVRRYAWGIPDPATLGFVAAHCGPRVLELGAGTGYWAWQLSQLGVDVLAYDTHPPDRARNHFHVPLEARERAWDPAAAATVEVPKLRTEPMYHPVRRGGAPRALLHPDRALLLVWPPYATPMAARALRAYTGDRLVYVGEGWGGCTGDDRFHAELDRWWSEVATHRPVQWWGIHDWVTVYDRGRRAPPAVLDGEERW